MINDWIDPNLLLNPAYLRTVAASVYVMQSMPLPNQFRVGIIGRNSPTNNAQNRLRQVDAGFTAAGKPHPPFQYVFLAPLPADLGYQLSVLETTLQKDLGSSFASSPAPTWRGTWTSASNIPNIQYRAQDIVLCFLQNRYAGSAAKLIRALQTFVSLPSPFHQDPRGYISAADFIEAEKARENVFHEAQKVFDVKVAQTLLKCLQPQLTVSSLPPCETFSFAVTDDPGDDCVEIEGES
jgi:hypothetical protein